MKRTKVNLPNAGEKYGLSDYDIAQMREMGIDSQRIMAHNIQAARGNRAAYGSVSDAIESHELQTGGDDYVYAKLEYQERLGRIREIMKSNLLPPPFDNYYFPGGKVTDIPIPEGSIICCIQSNGYVIASFGGNASLVEGFNDGFYAQNGQYFLIDNIKTMRLVSTNVAYTATVSIWREAQFI